MWEIIPVHDSLEFKMCIIRWQLAVCFSIKLPNPCNCSLGSMPISLNYSHLLSTWNQRSVTWRSPWFCGQHSHQYSPRKTHWSGRGDQGYKSLRIIVLISCGSAPNATNLTTCPLPWQLTITSVPSRCDEMRSATAKGITLKNMLLLLGAIQVLRNAFFLEIGPHPPPRNANNIEPYTIVTLFPRKSAPPPAVL